MTLGEQRRKALELLAPPPSRHDHSDGNGGGSSRKCRDCRDNVYLSDGGHFVQLLFEIHVGERPPVGVADDEAGVGLLDGPGRREAALGHSLRVAKFAKRGFDVAFDVIRCVWIFC